MPAHSQLETCPDLSRFLLRTGIAIAFAAMLLSGCEATLPVTGDRSITPKQVAAEDEEYGSSRIQWGGIIVNTRNLQHTTELELIAYPLGITGRPDTTTLPQGRFIAIKTGYLETVDYAKGRLATLDGIISGFRDGKVGDADYRYPTIDVDSMKLWPQDYGMERRPRIHFGIGVGSGGYSGGGIGIGF